MAGNMDEMVKKMEDYRNIAEKAAKEVERIKSSSKETVTHADGIRDAMKDIMEYSKKINTNLDAKTIKQAREHFKFIAEYSKNMLATGKMNANQISILSKNIKDSERAMAALNKHIGNENNLLKTQKGLWEDSHRSLKGMVDMSEKLSHSINGLKLNNMTKAFHKISGYMGRRGRHIGNFVNKAHEAHNVHMERQGKISANQATWAAKDLRTKELLKARHPELFDKTRREIPQPTQQSQTGGMPRVKGYKNRKGKDKGKKGRSVGAPAPTFEEVDELNLDKLYNSEAGRSFYADHMGTDATSKRYIRENMGTDNRMFKGKGPKIMEAAEAGGGDVIGGAAGMAEGRVASGMAGGIAGAAVPLGIIVGLGELLKDAFDAVSKQNREVEQHLGKGGVFTGDQGGADSLQNVKANLRAWGLNAAGVTTERNMKVAGAMQDSGVNVSELAEGEKARAMRGGFSEIADMAFKQAREIGLADEEGAKQSLKMLQTYHMTFKGTQDFFSTIGKDIRSSGISTTKYLELIDDVTSQFNSMSKSIGDVTTTLRVLGSTGTSTYEEMKNNIDGLNGTGANRTPEQRAFLYSQGNTKGLSEMLGKEADNAGNTFKDSLTDAITSVMPDKREKIIRNEDGTYLNMNTIEGRRQAYKRFKYELPQGFAGNAKTTQLEGQFKQDEDANTRRNMMKGGAVNAAFLTDLTGTTPSIERWSQVTALQQALGMGHKSLGSIVRNPGEFNDKNMAALTSLGGDAVGLSQKGNVMGLIEGIRGGIDNTVSELHGGLSKDVRKDLGTEDEETLYKKYLDLSGVEKVKGKSAKEQIQGMSAEQLAKFSDGLTDSLSTATGVGAMFDPNSEINKSLAARHKEPLKTQEDKIGDIAKATMNIDDRLKTISDNIISLLGVVVSWGIDKFGGSDRAANKEALGARNDTTVLSDVGLLSQAISKASEDGKFDPNFKVERSVADGPHFAGVIQPKEYIGASDLLKEWQDQKDKMGTSQFDAKLFNRDTQAIRKWSASAKGQLNDPESKKVIDMLNKAGEKLNKAGDKLMDSGSDDKSNDNKDKAANAVPKATDDIPQVALGNSPEDQRLGSILRQSQTWVNIGSVAQQSAAAHYPAAVTGGTRRAHGVAPHPDLADKPIPPDLNKRFTEGF